jgi:hypothetical protein
MSAPSSRCGCGVTSAGAHAPTDPTRPTPRLRCGGASQVPYNVELDRIIAALNNAVEEAEVNALTNNDDGAFREIVRHAREMYEIMSELMQADATIATPDLCTFRDATNERIRKLEELVDGPA